MTDEELAEVLEEIRGCPPMFRHKEDNNMSDYRYDILGHGGLSKASGTFTMASANTDRIIKDLAGKNLFHNSKPICPKDEGGEILGWTKAKANASSFVYEYVLGEYFKITLTPQVVEKNSATYQLSKEYKRNGSLYGNGNRGAEIKDIIGGVPITLSLEIKSNYRTNVFSAYKLTYNDGTENFQLNYLNEIIEPSDDWTKLSGTAILPENIKEMIEASNVKGVKFYIQLSLTDPVTETIPDAVYYLRNIKFEYGTEATDYSYSDWDEGYLNVEAPAVYEIGFNQEAGPNYQPGLTYRLAGTNDAFTYLSIKEFLNLRDSGAKFAYWNGKQVRGAHAASIEFTASSVSATTAVVYRYVMGDANTLYEYKYEISYDRSSSLDEETVTTTARGYTYDSSVEPM
jgi:hypothetical protein